MNLHIRPANLADPSDASRMVAILDSYAVDPVGGGHPLSHDVRERLVPTLRDHATALFDGAGEGQVE